MLVIIIISIIIIIIAWPFLESKFASVYQMSSKSDEARLKYSDKTTLKMAAVRHSGFVVTSFMILTLC